MVVEKCQKNKKVVTVFISFKYESHNKNWKLLHQNVALVTIYQSAYLTQNIGLMTFYQYMNEFFMDWVVQYTLRLLNQYLVLKLP